MLVTSFKLIVARLQLDWLVIMIKLFFYNTASGVYNSIQVKNVYNYSDARAKININPLGYGLNVLSKLNAVSYDFKDKNEPAAAAFRVGGDGKEIGLLAQEVEKVLPNID